jgi:hypothetical protein
MHHVHNTEKQKDSAEDATHPDSAVHQGRVSACKASNRASVYVSTHWRKKSGRVSWFCTISIVEPMIGYHVGPVPACERSVACRSVMTSHMVIVLKLGNPHAGGMDVDPQLLA